MAAVDTTIKYNAKKLEGLGNLVGLGDAVLTDQEQVAKVGRTTGATRGRI